MKSIIRASIVLLALLAGVSSLYAQGSEATPIRGKIVKSGSNPQYVITPIPGVGVIIKKNPGKSVQLSLAVIASSIQSAEGIDQKIVVKSVRSNGTPENPSLSIVYTTADGKSNTIILDVIGFNDDPNILANSSNPIPGIGVIVKRNPGSRACYTIPGTVDTIDTNRKDELRRR